ncbi:hypothetical protein ACFVHQ_19550 [Actinomycetes bacterium NPDC127524]
MEQICIFAMDSLNQTFPVRIVWREGIFNTKIGIVAKVDMLKREMKFDLLSGGISLPIDNIVSVERI